MLKAPEKLENPREEVAQFAARFPSNGMGFSIDILAQIRCDHKGPLSG
jgi:hypothetical protein